MRHLLAHGWLLSYSAWPFMKLRRCRRGWRSCSKLTMHWGPCLRGWNSLEWYPHQSPLMLWAWQAYMTQTHCAASMGWPTALGVGRRTKMSAQSSTTSGWCTIGLALCVKNVTVTCLPHWTPSAAMAGRTTNPQEREALMSNPCWHNCQQEAYGVNLS